MAAVEWVDRIHLDEDFLFYNPDAQPVMIRAGALGNGTPKADVLVSPQQKINVSSSPYATEYRLAHDLTSRPGILRKPETLVTYYLFHCGMPKTVSVEGISVAELTSARSAS